MTPTKLSRQFITCGREAAADHLYLDAAVA